MMKRRVRTILALSVAGLASAACADVIVFENDNPNFHLWPVTASGTNYDTLYLMGDSFDQEYPYTGSPVPVFYRYSSDGGSFGNGMQVLAGREGTFVAQGDSRPLYDDDLGEVVDVFGPRLLEPGDTLDGSASYVSDSFYGAYPKYYFWNNQVPPFEYFVPINEPFMVGVSIEINGDRYYGFVEFEMSTDFGVEIDLLRWGYESEPNTALVVPVSPCSGVDIAEPYGSVDFFDVSAFISLFGDGDLQADFTGDGTLDFFDISAFITAYGNGCP